MCIYIYMFREREIGCRARAEHGRRAPHRHDGHHRQAHGRAGRGLVIYYSIAYTDILYYNIPYYTILYYSYYPILYYAGHRRQAHGRAGRGPGPFVYPVVHRVLHCSDHRVPLEDNIPLDICHIENFRFTLCLKNIPVENNHIEIIWQSAGLGPFVSENVFARCFPLGIVLRGFPFQMKSFGNILSYYTYALDMRTATRDVKIAAVDHGGHAQR